MQFTPKTEEENETPTPAQPLGTNSRQRAQARLRLVGKISEYHRDLVATFAITRAGDHHSRAIDFARLSWNLQTHRHLGPRHQRLVAAKFNAAFANMHSLLWEGQTLTLLRGRAKQTGALNFPCAHNGIVKIAFISKPSMEGGKLEKPGPDLRSARSFTSAKLVPMRSLSERLFTIR